MNKRNPNCLLVFFLYFYLSGCIPGQQVYTQIPPAPTTSEINPGLAISTSEYNVIQPTPESLETHSTPDQPISDAEKDAIIGQLLKVNDCPKPCFFEIEPINTTLDHLEQIVHRMGLSLFKSTPEKYHFGYDYKDILGIDVAIHVKNLVVTGLRAYLGGLFYPEVSTKDWQAFLPSSIVRFYGEPSDIRLNMEFSHEGTIPQDQVTFDLFLSYTNSPFSIIYYSGPYTLKNNQMEFCVNTTNYNRVEMWMGDYTEGLPPPGAFQRLQTVTTLTVEEYYRSMIEAPDEFCMSLDAEKFR